MIGLVTRQLQAEICFDRRADVRRPAVVDRPAAVFILMAENVVGTFPQALLVTGAQKSVHQDVIGFERGVGFKFAAPIAILMLPGK